MVNRQGSRLPPDLSTKNEGKVLFSAIYIIYYRVKEKNKDSYMPCKQWPTKQVGVGSTFMTRRKTTFRFDFFGFHLGALKHGLVDQFHVFWKIEVRLQL